MDTLKELYIDQLQDIWSANEQAHRLTEQFAKKASDEQLMETLERSVQRIKEHNARLEQVIRDHGASPSAEHCKGMEGLVTEAKRHALEKDYSKDAVRDAQIISQYQRIAHYGIAAYGTCRAVAEQLGFNDEAKQLAQDLEDVKKGDSVLNHIALDSVNQRAA